MEKKFKKRLIEATGWYGTAAIICSFALSSFSILTPSDLVYQLLNLTGAAGLILDSFYKKDYQPGVLNIIWIIITLIAIVKILFIT